MSFREMKLAALIALLVLVFVVSLLSKYLLTPLKIWRTSFSQRSRAVPLSPEAASAEVRAAVAELAQEVEPLGFDLKEVSDINDGKAVALHVYNPTTHEHLIDYHFGKYRWQVLRTQFSDGQEVVTANAPSPSIFTLPRGLHSCSLPPETGLTALHRAHQAHVRLAVGQATPVPGSLAGNYVVEQEERAMRSQVEHGVYRVAGEGYRPTLRGAFLITWRLLPPLKARRAAANQRMANQILAGA
jgi:hypothetical protein